MANPPEVEQAKRLASAALSETGKPLASYREAQLAEHVLSLAACVAALQQERDEDDRLRAAAQEVVARRDKWTTPGILHGDGPFVIPFALATAIDRLAALSSVPGQPAAEEKDPAEGLPPDLVRVLRDPTITFARDHELRLADGRTLFEHLEEWRNAPSNTASAQPAAKEAEPQCYCGYLGWTVEKWGRVTHKQGCPARTDPWHQGDPQPAAEGTAECECGHPLTRHDDGGCRGTTYTDVPNGVNATPCVCAAYRPTDKEIVQ